MRMSEWVLSEWLRIATGLRPKRIQALPTNLQETLQAVLFFLGPHVPNVASPNTVTLNVGYPAYTW